MTRVFLLWSSIGQLPLIKFNLFVLFILQWFLIGYWRTLITHRFLHKYFFINIWMKNNNSNRIQVKNIFVCFEYGCVCKNLCYFHQNAHSSTMVIYYAATSKKISWLVATLWFGRVMYITLFTTYVCQFVGLHNQ